jgi:hypothetical protein
MDLTNGSHLLSAEQLEIAAANAFAAGQAANQHSDDYVLNTVLLAMVLFFVALAEHLKWHVVKVVILLVTLGLLLLGLSHLATYPLM